MGSVCGRTGLYRLYCRCSVCRPVAEPPPVKLRWVVLYLVVAYLLVGTVDYASARVTSLIMLETSTQPATLDEAMRTYPGLGRPQGCISLQNGSDAPWHHRCCWWTE